jgi:hypothetical protein
VAADEAKVGSRHVEPSSGDTRDVQQAHDGRYQQL